MRTPFKALTFLITGLALFATGCFERSDLYGPLHDGVKMIYAVNPSAYYAYIATEDGYLKKLTVPSTGATGVGAYPVNGKPVILENVAGQLTFYVYENSSWSTVSHSIGTLVSPVRYESTVYYTNSDAIYSFDGKTVQTLVSSVATPASILALACYNDEIYVLGDDYKIYRFNGTDTCVSTGTGSVTAGTTLLYFTIVDGVVYAGYDNTFNYGALGGAITTISSLSNIQSYAVYDASHVFAAGFNGAQFEIMKCNGASFATFKTIVDTAGTISLAALSATTLAVGICGSTAHDGLYVLDTETGEMTMLIAESIGAVNVYNSI
jgi:hypothetical protein